MQVTKEYSIFALFYFNLFVKLLKMHETHQLIFFSIDASQRDRTRSVFVMADLPVRLYQIVVSAKTVRDSTKLIPFRTNMKI